MKPVSMLRITAGRISLSGDLYRLFDQFDFDNILSGHGCIRVAAGGGRDRIGPCLAETFHPVIKSPRFDIVFQTPVIVRKPTLAAFQYQFVLFFHWNRFCPHKILPINKVKRLLSGKE